MKRLVIAGVGAAVLVVAIAASRFTLSALSEPGRAETFFATKAKHYLVRRSSSDGVPAPPRDRVAGLKEGERLFGMECAACHGLSGRDPTDAGRGMYPRAADLTSPGSQSYSDHEIFWVVKNGIRWSGMPAFGSVEPDEDIWDLVFYVRALPKTSAAEPPIEGIPEKQPSQQSGTHP
ncbi:MAG: c-type cytochrome [Candidatus Sulfotelmatobacter sp.]